MASERTVIGRIETTPTTATNTSGTTDPILWHTLILDGGDVIPGMNTFRASRVVTLCGIEIPPIGNHYPVVLRGAPDAPTCEGCLNSTHTPELIDEIEQFLRTPTKELATA